MSIMFVYRLELSLILIYLSLLTLIKAQAQGLSRKSFLKSGKSFGKKCFGLEAIVCLLPEVLRSMLSEDILKPKENETPTGKKKRNRKPPVNPATINQFAVKVRIKPTPEQIVMFEKTFGCCRKIWNLMLADK